MEALLDIVYAFMAMAAIVLSTFGFSDTALIVSVAGLCMCLAELIVKNIGGDTVLPPPPE